MQNLKKLKNKRKDIFPISQKKEKEPKSVAHPHGSPIFFNNNLKKEVKRN